MTASNGEVSKGKLAFAYLLKKEIAEQMPGVVGDFLLEMVEARVTGAYSNGHATATVAPPAKIAPEAPVTRSLEAAPPGRAGHKMSEATKAKISATYAARKAARRANEP